MYTKSYDQLLIMKAMIDANRQDYDEKIMKLTAELTAVIGSIMDQIKVSISSPENMNSPKEQDTITEVPDNRKAPPLEGGSYKTFGGMWTLKYDISLPKFYELLFKT